MFRAIRPFLYTFDPETAHGLALLSLRLLPARQGLAPHPALHQFVAGLSFPNPVGLAAGFDKDGVVAHRMAALGFGFAELGTLTPLPQQGNPKPRLFRLTKDKAIINRMGFNNGGQAAAVDRFQARDQPKSLRIGVNIGTNKDSADRVRDYARGAAAMAPYADYLAVNISSPNTPGLRALQDPAALDDLLLQVKAALNEAVPRNPPPVFLKVAPDLTSADIDDICRISLARGMDGLIVSNTTIERPPLASRDSEQSGGLSGAPLRDLAQTRIADFHRALGGALPLIGVGGIATAQHAYARIRAGASLVQLYTALIYEGPKVATRINAGLVRLLARDGLANIADAVGLDAK